MTKEESVSEMIRLLKALDRCSNGGLLQKIIQNKHIDNETIIECRNKCIEYTECKEHGIGFFICNELLEMTIEQRENII